jgi:hypothetical protein
MKNKRIVNLIIWCVFAICFMIGTYFAWSEEGHYGWLQFLASFLFDFGLCFAFWFWCDDYIKHNNHTSFDLEEYTMKTFEDLTFRSMNSKYYPDCQQAIMYFDNGYGVSVLLGRQFYSNGVNTYEVTLLKDGKMSVVDPYTDAVVGYCIEEEVDKIMKVLQQKKN